MKNRVLAALILILPAGLFFYFWFCPVAEKKLPSSGHEVSQDNVLSNALVNQNPAVVATIASHFARVQPVPGSADAANGMATFPAGQPVPLQFTNFSPAIVLENTGRAIRQYGAMFGGNPVGTNLEITRQLAGNNPRHINFLNAESGMRVNENGELVDPWGTPYFFHQLSGQEMEIRSAGADGKMWTLDDLVAR